MNIPAVGANHLLVGVERPANEAVFERFADTQVVFEIVTGYRAPYRTRG